MRFVVVGQGQPELPVDLRRVRRVRLRQDGQQSAHRVDEPADLIAGESSRGLAVLANLGEPDLRGDAFGLDLTAPGGDEGRVAAGLGDGTVLGELAIAFGDHAPQSLGLHVLPRLRVLHRGQRVLDQRCGEGLGEPVVDRVLEVRLAQVDVERVVDLVREGVLIRVPAAVVRLVVGPIPLHTPTTTLVEQKALERVAVVRTDDLAAGRGRAAFAQAFLNTLEPRR
ncbi:hypothetical protein [Streptantibioticus silvisoli]|uniref:Uncharacterized protein n=1 Tax=Streptantibioticus silvisoli TaxID=2705255 RepID=A0ABT6VZW7_9ACTN|nr:hypothetical protein [Streptantibioticus silvisoli]MDI5964036.1 hypothetical protein [Streptantibioticus silvisoli]